ncbi:MAG: DMT family transporter [Gaiellaceae bacterium]
MARAAIALPAVGPFFLLGAAVLMWGTGWWPIALASEHAPPLTVAGLRTAPAIPVLLLALPMLGGRLPRGRLLFWAVLTGLIMVAFFQFGLTEGVARMGAGNTAVLVNTPPLIVAVLAWLMLRERLSRRAVLGLPLGFAGVVLMVSAQLSGDISTRALLTGVAFALTAALGWALGTMLLRYVAQRNDNVDMVGITAVQYVVAGSLLFPLALAVNGVGDTDWSSPELWASVVWIGPAAALATILFFASLKRLPAARASAWLFLIPTIAVLLEIARGRAPDAVVLAGMALTIVGVALVNVPHVALAGIPGAVLGRIRAGSIRVRSR